MLVANGRLLAVLMQIPRALLHSGRATRCSEVAHVHSQDLQLAGGVGAMLYGINILNILRSWLCHLLAFRFIVVRCVPVIPQCMLFESMSCKFFWDAERCS